MSTTIRTTQRFLVIAYSVGRSYGGPEEGGWWYDTGELVEFHDCYDSYDAVEAQEILERKYPHTGKRMSVLGGEDYDVRVFQKDDNEEYLEVSVRFPSERPFYE